MDGGVGEGRGAGMDMFLTNYKLGKTLGLSMLGKKKIAEHVLTGQKIILEILKRGNIKNMEMEEQALKSELEILRLLEHPRILNLYEVIETPTDICVVMEYSPRELFDYIIERGRLEEDEARNIFQQIISGVEYCHSKMVVHRDLRPENILLDFNCDVKITGFGLSNIMHGDHFLKTSFGSCNYVAPEVICGKLYIGPEVDVWSCGVVLYFILCGILPFDDENIPNLFHKIKGGVFPLPCYLSPGARDLISKMLNVEPSKRITISEIQQHPWLQDTM